MSSPTVTGLRAGDVMTSDVLTVDADQGLLLTWELVCQAGVHHVPVLEHGRCLGLLAERDLALEIAANPLGHPRRLVRELTDAAPAYVDVDTPVGDVARQLLDTGKDAILVHTKAGRLVGLVTVHDLLRVLTGQTTRRSDDQGRDFWPTLFELTPVLPSATP